MRAAVLSVEEKRRSMRDSNGIVVLAKKGEKKEEKKKVQTSISGDPLINEKRARRML